MSFTYRYRKQIIIASIFVFLCAFGSFFLYHKFYSFSKKSNIVSKKRVLLASKDSSKDNPVKKVEKSEDVLYLVDIKGEVVLPGLYSLKEGSRVSDVIQMAGGLTENADTSVINLSKKIADEMVIIVYSKDEVENFKVTKEVEKQIQTECLNSYEGVLNGACIDSSVTPADDVNDFSAVSINTATLEELETLPGIGEAKAKSIIQYRDEHGGFNSIDELKEVTGIGDSVFDQIKENITL